MDNNDFEKLIRQLIEDENKSRISDFEGLSPDEMHLLVYSPFAENSPLQLAKLTDEEYKQIPIFNLAKTLMLLINESGTLKLTEKGFLPVKVVADLYQRGFFKEDYIERGIQKLYKEADSQTISMARILLDIAGLTKKRNGKMSLTATGTKALAKDELLLSKILEAALMKFNWGYFDGYENPHVAHVGACFSLFLLSKYGAEKRTSDFYAEKYFKAFPTFQKNEFSPKSIEYLNRCYSLRNFERYFNYFGFIELELIGTKMDKTHYAKKSDFFDKLFVFNLGKVDSKSKG